MVVSQPLGTRSSLETGTFVPPPELAEAYETTREVVARTEYDALRVGGYAEFTRRLGIGIGRDWQHSRVRYAILTGELTDKRFESWRVSDTDVIALHAPFGRTLEATMLSAELVRRLAVAAGVRDKEDRTLPLVMLSAPTGNAGIRLCARSLDQVKQGDMGPIARVNLGLLKRLFDRLDTLILSGCSYGGTIAVAAARVAKEVRININVTSLITGSPGNIILDRPHGDLFSSFTQEGRCEDVYTLNRPGVFGAVPTGNGPAFWRGLARQTRISLALMSGLAVGSFGDDLIQAHKVHVGLSTKVGLATNDLVVPQRGIDPLIARVSHEAPNADVEWKLFPGRHRWPDNPFDLGALAFYALQQDAAIRSAS